MYPTTPSALVALLVMAVVGLLALTRTTDASPVLLDKLFGFAAYQPTYSGGGYSGNQYYGYYGGGGGGGGSNSGSGFGAVARATSPSSQKRQAKGRDYKDICRVVNPAPYAMPGRAPYPAAPFCPY
uniref:Putative secreted protein n=2 Tax=Anopheles triannulatus TaxID=58253 RepID=A0A2M4AS48_9DIPT